MEIKDVVGLFKVLSWTKIAQFSALAIICLLALLAWQGKEILYNSLKVKAVVETEEPIKIKTSEQTNSYIDNILTKSSNISGIQIINVNFRKNTRSTAYFTISDRILRDEVEDHRKKSIADTPLFNENETNNQRLINLINGDFVCTDFKDTIGGKIWPKAATSVTTVCSISVPPYYGRFSGYVNVYLNRKPDSSDIILLKQLMRDISLRIYEKDIK